MDSGKSGVASQIQGMASQNLGFEWKINQSSSYTQFNIPDDYQPLVFTLVFALQ